MRGHHKSIVHEQLLCTNNFSQLTLAVHAGGLLAYVGTADGNMYQVLVELGSGGGSGSGAALRAQLVQSAHSGPIHALAFPDRYGEVRGALCFGMLQSIPLEAPAVRAREAETGSIRL